MTYEYPSDSKDIRERSQALCTAIVLLMRREWVRSGRIYGMRLQNI